MIAEKETDTVGLSLLLKNRFPIWTKGLIRVLEDLKVPVEWIPGTKDIWARDYMPAQVQPHQFVSFRYEPDYLLGHEDVKTPRDAIKQYLKTGLIESDLVIDGGNLVTSGDKVLLTDKIYDENRGRSPKDLQRQLSRDLNAEALVIPREPFDPIGHSDGISRFLDNGETLLINDYRKVHPNFHDKLIRQLHWMGLEYELIPYTPEEPGRVNGIPSAVGNYINYLRVGNNIVVPVYRRRTDDEAVKVVERTHPDCTIRTLDCTPIAKEGGVLNCITWSIKKTA